MNHKTFFYLIGFCFLLASGCKSTAQPPAQSFTQANVISGVVLAGEAPLPGAVVRIKTTQQFTTTDMDGRFVFSDILPHQPVVLTAWAPGYYIGGGEQVAPGAENVKIHLIAHADSDNKSYEWLSAFSSAGEEGNCQNCHADPADVNAALPFSEWQKDAHALSAQNPRFLTMYQGQDLDGNQSPITRYAFDRDYGRFPLQPDPDQPYFGPGYKLDFPDTAGNCAACHVPAAAIDAAYNVDPTDVAGVGAEGATCDFCHKIWDVRLDPSSGLPQANMPGVLSYEFRRPPAGHQFFAGPLDDVAPGEDTYTPVQRQGQYCAACHFGIFWDTQVYNSFGEWLESPYSDLERAKTAGLSSPKSCQDCHMPPGLNDHFVLIEKGGERRDPQTIFSHRMPGASDETLLQNAVTLKVDAHREGEEIIVDVRILNDQTGHHVPTDSPLRQLILLVQASGPDGEALEQLDGAVVPEWGGEGNPDEGYYAGLPGNAYAKILMELWTEVTPASAYWNPTRVVSDNRLAAFEEAASQFAFAAPNGGEATIEVSLLFRRAFKDLMDLKGWNVSDILMEHQTVRLNE